MMQAGKLSEIDFLVEWEGHAEPTWNPALNHTVRGVLEPVAAEFLRFKKAQAARAGRSRPAARGRSRSRRRACSSVASSSSRRARRARGQVAARRAASAGSASSESDADEEDHLNLEQWYDDHRPLSHLAAKESPRSNQVDQTAAAVPSQTSAADGDGTDAAAAAAVPHAQASAAGVGWQASGWHTLSPSLTQALIPDGVPALAMNGTDVSAESGAHTAAPAGDSVVERAAAAYQVTRVERVAGSDWHRWRYLDAQFFPSEDALLKAMRKYYISSRMQYWQQFCSPEHRQRLDALSESKLAAADAVALFADWMVEMMRPAAASVAAASAAAPSVAALPLVPPLCTCCSHWQAVLDQIHFDDDDKQQMLRDWSSEPVWLCVYSRRALFSP